MVDKFLAQKSLDDKEPELNLTIAYFGILVAILGVILIILSFLFSTMVPYRDIILIIAGAFIGFSSLSLDEYVRNFPERKRLYSYLNNLRTTVNNLKNAVKTYGPEKEELDIMTAGFGLAFIIETGNFSQEKIELIESLLNKSDSGLNTSIKQKLDKLPHSTKEEGINIAKKIKDNAKKILPGRENAAFRVGIDIFSLAVVMMHSTQNNASEIIGTIFEDFENILPNLTPETKITNFLIYIINFKEQIQNVVNNGNAERAVDLLKQISSSKEYLDLDLDRLIV